MLPPNTPSRSTRRVTQYSIDSLEFNRSLSAHIKRVAPSAASNGLERQRFIEALLSQLLPPQFRFGSGDAIDLASDR
jgi:hypothetical protein